MGGPINYEKKSITNCGLHPPHFPKSRCNLAWSNIYIYFFHNRRWHSCSFCWDYRSFHLRLVAYLYLLSHMLKIIPLFSVTVDKFKLMESKYLCVLLNLAEWTSQISAQMLHWSVPTMVHEISFVSINSFGFSTSPASRNSIRKYPLICMPFPV